VEWEKRSNDKADWFDDILASKMNEIQRRQPTKWDSKRKRTSERITDRDKAAILKIYEKGLKKGQDRGELLSGLARRYDRSERQIERYIQQAKEKRESEQREQATQIVVTVEERSRALAEHYEAIRGAIKLWIEKQRPASAEELAAIGEGKLSAWGVTAEVTPEGQGRSGSTMGSHPLYNSLRFHLAVPVVGEDFWEKVSDIIGSGLSLLTAGVDCFKEIEKAAQEHTGLGIVGSKWQEGSAIGLTQSFVQTNFEHALSISQFTNWGYSIWGIAWPNTGGYIVTSEYEGVRLLQGRGFDPAIMTRRLLEGKPWMLPQSPNERIAYGDANTESPGGVGFLLCFGEQVIAVDAAPENLELCREAHKTMMVACASGGKATALKRMRIRLDSLSEEIRHQLEKAQYQPSFPGRCPLCP
jgi:hypothetical protein